MNFEPKTPQYKKSAIGVNVEFSFFPINISFFGKIKRYKGFFILSQYLK